MIKAGVKDVLGKLGRVKPFKIAPPCHFELAYHVSAQTDTGATLGPAKRLDARTLTFTADDYLERFRTLKALISIAPGR